MQVRLATYQDKEAWDDYVLKSLYGTAYQLFAWAEAIEMAYAFKMVYLLAESEHGICGVLPLVEFRIPMFGRTLISLPYCDAGGVLADDQNVEQALLKHARSKAEEGKMGLKIRSARPILYCGQNQTDKVSMLLKLPVNSEILLASFKSSLRSQVRKPLRDGLTIMVGKGDLIDTFYAVFAENMRDLGSPVHARDWFQAIVKVYEDRVRVAVVYTPDKVAAAAGIVLLHPSRVSIPWASSLRRFNSKNPNMLLYWNFLAFAADNGYDQFDFGRSTPEEGTYRFKSQWGAEPHQLYWYESDNASPTTGKKTKAANSHVGNHSTRRQLVEALWRELPQPGANWLGPKIRKYISL